MPSTVPSSAGVSAAALLAACESGDDAEVFHQLSHGVSVESRDVSGDTALACAAYNGHLSTCILLLRHGANTNATSTASGDTVERIAQPHDAAFELAPMLAWLDGACATSTQGGAEEGTEGK